MAAQAKFPTLRPADAIGGIADALRTFVFDNPKLKAACARAEVVSKETGFRFHTIEDFELANFGFPDTSWLSGIRGCDDLLILMHHAERDKPCVLLAEAPQPRSAVDEDAISALDKYIREMPTEIEAAFDAVDASFHRLFGMLRKRQLVAWGSTADGHLVRIPGAIWSRGDFFLHPETGDVYLNGTPGNPTVMWFATELRLPETAAAPAKVSTKATVRRLPKAAGVPAKVTTKATPKPANLTAGEDVVCDVIISLTQSGELVGLKASERDKRIMEALKKNGGSGYGPTTIKRCLRKMKIAWPEKAQPGPRWPVT
jgi:hypothetical protein